MSLFRRGNTWWFSLYLNGKRIRKSLGTSNRKEAELAYAKILEKLHTPQQSEKVQYSMLTYEEFFWNHYIPYCEGRHASIRTKKYIYNVIPDWFRRLKLTEIATVHIERLQSAQLQRGVSVSTVNKICNLVMASLRKAYDWDYITEFRIKYHPLKGETKRLRYLTEEECIKLINVAREPLRSMIIIALHTGMRKGEILGLRWEDIDFKNRVIHLEKTKNHERRDIHMNETVYQTLLRLKTAPQVSLKWVFVNPKTGERFERCYPKREFQQVCKKAGIEDFHFHDLRHTFASHLVMRGVDIKTVQELLGHKKIEMTLRYSHLAESHKAEAVRKLDTIWSQFWSQLVR